MKLFLFLLSLFLYFSFIGTIPINDTSILRDIVLVTENTIDQTVLKYPYIIMLYYDIRDEICKNFYYEFLKLRAQTKQIHPDLKLGVFEMAPSLNTADKLSIHKHPHVKLFIHGIENEHFSHHYRPFQSHHEIFEWAKAEIHRISTKPHSAQNKNLHHEIKITQLTKNANFSVIFKASNSKIIFCSQQPHILEVGKMFNLEKFNITEVMQKLKHAFSRDDVKFYIAHYEYELCQNNSGNLMIFGSHEKHPPTIVNPRQMDIREISKIIKRKVNHHLLLSKNHDFIDKLWKTNKPLVLLFLNREENYKQLVKNLDLLVENHFYVNHLQFGVVDFQTSHGKTLFEKFRLSLDSLPSIMITHDISHKSQKFMKKIEGDDLQDIESFVEKYFKDDLKEHRVIKTKRAIIHENHPFKEFKSYLHLSADDFNKTIDSNAPIIVIFYNKVMNFDGIMNLYETVLEHVKEEYDFHFKLATFDLFHNDVDNIGYYNIDRMPGVFLYLNTTWFIDLTNFSHTNDIRNILYVLEKHMKEKTIKYHSAKAIRTTIQEKSKLGKNRVNDINIKNEL